MWQGSAHLSSPLGPTPGTGGVGVLQAAGPAQPPCPVESQPKPILLDECDLPLKRHQPPGREGQAQRLQTMALSAATSEDISRGLDGIILIYTGFCFFPGT